MHQVLEENFLLNQKVLMEVFFYPLSTALRGVQSLCFHSLLSSLLAWDF